MSTIKEILQKNQFNFNKRYGQNFLTDKNLLDAIVADAMVQPTDMVLEIGAGAGTLTRALANVANKVVAYEIDENLRPVLGESLQGLNNVEIVWQDFMQASQAELAPYINAKVVANLPYYVTTPILIRLLEWGIGQSITIMVQKEVAERFTALPNSKEYGAITVKINLWGTATLTRMVGRQLFYPSPNVDSAVVHLIHEPRRYFDNYPDLTAKVVRCAFSMRRKTLINNLIQGLNCSREAANCAVQSIDFLPTVRGETLSAKQFIALSSALHSLGIV